MRQFNLIKPKKLKMEEVPNPVPKKDEVLIKVHFCGICGSDIHSYYGKHPFVHPPIVLGHEFSGEIAEWGRGVTGLKVGQRVTVEPLLVCGKCYNCLNGRYNICYNLKVIGCHAPGAFADYVLVPKNRVIPLPKNVSTESAALTEPLAVGVHMIKIAKISSSDRVLILGAGPIGIMVLQVAKVRGCENIMITDVIEERLKLAKKLGAKITVNVSREDANLVIKKRWGKDGADVILECVGSPATIRKAIELARKGTKIVVGGVFTQEVKLPIGLVQDRELELVGSLVYKRDDFEEGLNLIAKGLVDVESLITHHFGLKELPQAFKFIEENKAKVLKVLIKIKDG